ncbi:MAG TPA: TIGR02444 family protein [Caulobacteraceae bacterium]
MTLWEFAVMAWDRPGVSEVCLRLQDRHGQCVPLLLWRAWAEAEGRCVQGEPLADALALALMRERVTIAPLRSARRSLEAQKSQPAVEAARDAEIEAERALLNALEELTPAPAPRVEAGGDLVAALDDLVDAWNGGRAHSAVGALAARLT